MKSLLLSLCMLLTVVYSQAQKSPMNEKTFKGLELRSVGPSFTSGRIGDIAIHPDNDNIWYVAVASGGVWKTMNSGMTWKSIFDGQASYSIGCITIDPTNPHTIWVGSGENVGGRHVGFGDGIYKSEDDGKSWKNMGLKNSEHISKIIVHPENADIVWVAVQGPLWKSGGERGLYKTIDGGKSWNKTLGGNEWTGVTDITIDPRDPNWLYAATWQRHRTVAAYMGGGPGSGLHRSTDGGATWEKLTSGIPGSNLGKIGLAISPQNPDNLYAAIELDLMKGGLFMSTNRGKTWTKQSDAVSGGTGPHYYQELYASPHAEGRLYMANNSMIVSDDYGKTFRRLKRDGVHSDSHSLNFKEDDPNYLLMGTDGGIYESNDLAQNWRFIDNMPITQYYKLAVDDAMPFYNIYGGTQDNGSHGGPSRTDTQHGIRNADWWKTLGGDGHQSAIEPGNPNITYAETQGGGLHRIDQITGDQVFIQPQPKEGDGYERFNWDAPILVSPHNPARLYVGSHRVWQSENRGDSWTAISGDLTKQQQRIKLPIMGKLQSWDNPWDLRAMSNYSSITSLAESPVQEGLVYAGTDDGSIQMTDNGGETWTKTNLGSIKGLPPTPFVNDVRADLFDANTVYAAMDNHKYGDFKPYLIKSTDRGKTWSIMSGDLPAKHLTWRLVQDHVDKNLLFAATEFGIFFTKNGGTNWIKLSGKAPNISFRDITIQRRENDLVAASFGRSFYVLDDISPLRDVSAETLGQPAKLFATKDAYWYNQRSLVSSQGGAKYAADNPPFGAVFTYYLKDELTTLKGERKKKEKALEKENKDIPFPGFEALEAEGRQEKPQIRLTVKDANGNLVNQVDGKNKAGINRVSWNLGLASKNGIRLEQGQGGGGFRRGGFKATPGVYTVTLSKVVDGIVTDLAGPQEFNVVPLRDKGALEGASFEEMIAMTAKVQALQEDITATSTVLSNSMKRISAMQTASSRLDKQSNELVTRIYEAKKMLQALSSKMNGNEAMGIVGEGTNPSPSNRMFVGLRGLRSTYGPTEMHKENIEIGKRQLAGLKAELMNITDTVLPGIEKSLKDAGAPWIEGQPISEN
jgi:photosystem II stability/assembly factor-like uncharacterized protein